MPCCSPRSRSRRRGAAARYDRLVGQALSQLTDLQARTSASVALPSHSARNGLRTLDQGSVDESLEQRVQVRGSPPRARVGRGARWFTCALLGETTATRCRRGTRASILLYPPASRAGDRPRPRPDHRAAHRLEAGRYGLGRCGDRGGSQFGFAPGRAECGTKVMAEVRGPRTACRAVRAGSALASGIAMKILHADDHPMFREGVRFFLKLLDAQVVVLEASNIRGTRQARVGRAGRSRGARPADARHQRAGRSSSPSTGAIRTCRS